MSDPNNQTATAAGEARHLRTFVACFVALVATSFAFVIRAMLIGDWQQAFDLSETQKGEIFGAGLWPFGVSIVLFSLIIDKVGYARSMIFAFLCHAASAFLLYQAKGYNWLYFGSLLNGLAAGTVEAVINPAVASMYSRHKTRMLSILHAGWPAGLVLGGLLVILAPEKMLWQSKVLFVAIPVVLYGILMIMVWNRFPRSERVLAGVPYRDMLKEAGTLSWFIVIYMVAMEVARQFNFSATVTWSVIIVTTVIYFAYTRSLGKPMYIFLLLVMLLLATTELGVDSWVTDLMEPAMSALGAKAGWVLVYTSLVMMILRFCIAPIERRLKPLGVLLVCAVLAAIGLNLLSIAKLPLMILLAATVYGAGKAFFWPVTLGVVAERFPRGGALTLNAVAGVGMLAVGVLGNPSLGYIQDTQIRKSMMASGHAAIYKDISVTRTSIFGEYQALDGKKEAAVLAGSEFKDSVTEAKNTAKAKALRIVSILPAIMAACYLGLILFFKTRGGYKAVELQAATPDE